MILWQAESSSESNSYTYLYCALQSWIRELSSCVLEPNYELNADQKDTSLTFVSTSGSQ